MAVMEWIQSAMMGFIGLDIFPLFPTPEQSASYPVIPMEALLDADTDHRAPRGTYKRDDWEFERGYFVTSEKGREEPIDDTERKLFNREAPGLADMVATQRAYQKIMRSQEKRIADKLFNASNFTANAVTNEWDDATNATPVDDVSDGVAAFRLQCGMFPDALVISWPVFKNLKKCDQVVDRLKYTFPGIDLEKMTSAQLATLFDVPRVLVGGAVYNSAKKGLSASLANLWSTEYAALVKIGSGMDITEPCVGRTFLWTEDSPANPIVEEYREEASRSDIIRVRHHVDEALIQSKDDSGTVVSNVASACCYLFSNITT